MKKMHNLVTGPAMYWKKVSPTKNRNSSL